ncbi:hypothetical protein [Pseudomonas sp. Irchel 3A5]|uniref:hypothetical protein n=1 Tax=Pseudomonas sp. Irchel 3A5 TaxID=2008911 RepID=UPI000BA2F9E3|nr:hypothetical protein [Pseudomonas sp. Irchel 3A5]
MIIKLVPQRRDDQLSVVKSGSILTVNGEVFDFGPVTVGATLPEDAITSVWFAGDVENIDGELTLTLLLPLPRNFSQEQAFPADLLNVPDGPVELPQPNPEAFNEQAAEEAV